MRVVAFACLVFLAQSMLPASAQNRPFAPVVDALTHEVVVPAYARFADVAAQGAARVAELCATPSADTLSAARAGFASLVVAFAHIEPYRFGPARSQNRFERLFFWPDRRGRGLRQVQRLIATEDPTGTDVGALTGKSVAVQGLAALEYSLFGTASDSLAEAGGHRCDYARTVGAAIAAVGADMAAEWDASFASTLTGAGADNPAYRNDGEALQDILQAAVNILEGAVTQKITAVIGESVDVAKPKRAPFWRSDLTLAMILANMDAVRSVLEGGAADLFQTNTLVDAAIFAIGQADRVLTPLMDDPRPFVELASDPDAHRRLAFAAIQLDAARGVIGEQMQGTLGLAAGFNALDGD